ncbi:MAG: hypothetical protein ACRBBR_16735 [Cellvibrionaceae bacterium]
MFRLYKLFLVGFSSAILFSSNTLALDSYEWSMDINTGSKHSDQSYKNSYGNNQYYNEDNEGFGITYGYKDYLDIKMGFFENSYFKTSTYIGAVLNKDFYIFNDIVISPGLGLMLTTGYDDTPIDAPVIAPIFHPSISFGHKLLRSTIGYIPYGEDKVITFQTQILF